MSWARDALAALKKVILMEDRMTMLTGEVKLLAAGDRDLAERVARIEGKLEAYERMASAAAQRRLPEPEEKDGVVTSLLNALSNQSYPLDCFYGSTPSPSSQSCGRQPAVPCCWPIHALIQFPKLRASARSSLLSA
jgi:hypothetical protein